MASIKMNLHADQVRKDVTDEVPFDSDAVSMMVHTHEHDLRNIVRMINLQEDQIRSLVALNRRLEEQVESHALELQAMTNIIQQLWFAENMPGDLKQKEMEVSLKAMKLQASASNLEVSSIDH